MAVAEIWDEDWENELLGMGRQYLQWMHSKNYSPQTLRAHRYYLGYFIRWCHDLSITKPTEVSVAVVDRYCDHLCRVESKKCKGTLSDNSRRLYLKSLFGFFRWLVKMAVVLFNPVDRHKFTERGHQLPQMPLTLAEIEQVFAMPDLGKPMGIRDRAILEMLYSTGIRRSELVQLNIEDIDFARGTLIVQGKGKKDRVVPIGQRAIAWLETYLTQSRPKLGRTGQPRLFLTRYGAPFKSPDVLTSILGTYMRASGLGYKGACHIFRHAMATHMLKNGANIRYIQEMLGHASLSTTQIYTQLEIESLKDVHRRTHPAHQQPQARQPTCTVAPQVRNPPRRHDINDLTSFWGQQQPTPLLVLTGEYLNSMQTRYAATTIDSRRKDLKLFLLWLQQRDVAHIQQITTAIVLRYQNFLAHCRTKDNCSLSAGRRKCRLVSVSTFLSWAYQHHHLLHNPASAIDLPKIPRRLPRNILTYPQVEQLLTQPNLNTANGIRDRAILETFYSTGARRAELARLQIVNVNFAEGAVKVTGKGQKDRVVPIGERALFWIGEYLKVRPLFAPLPEEQTLFVNKYGQPFFSGGLGDLVRQYLKAAGLYRAGSCHILRHCMATHMLENGADIRYIKEILGHAELSTTEIYTLVSIGKLKEVHQLTHPTATLSRR